MIQMNNNTLTIMAKAYRAALADAEYWARRARRLGDAERAAAFEAMATRLRRKIEMLNHNHGRPSRSEAG